MLDDMNDTVSVILNITIEFKNAPEVWAVLADYPAEDDYYEDDEVDADDKDDDGRLSTIVAEVEVQLGKNDTKEERHQAIGKIVRKIRDQIPLRSELTEKIQVVYCG
jgi:hypothetical protein